MMISRRAAARQGIALIDRQRETFEKAMAQAEPEQIREAVYQFHPYTSGERGDAERNASTLRDDGQREFDQNVFNQEIVDACVDNLSEMHPGKDAESCPYSVVTALAERIISVSEPGRSDVAFFLLSRQTSVTGR